jgi:hypothetical protein
MNQARVWSSRSILFPCHLQQTNKSVSNMHQTLQNTAAPYSISLAGRLGGCSSRSNFLASQVEARQSGWLTLLAWAAVALPTNRTHHRKGCVSVEPHSRAHSSLSYSLLQEKKKSEVRKHVARKKGKNVKIPIFRRILLTFWSVDTFSLLRSFEFQSVTLLKIRKKWECVGAKNYFLEFSRINPSQVYLYAPFWCLPMRSLRQDVGLNQYFREFKLLTKFELRL